MYTDTHIYVFEGGLFCRFSALSLLMSMLNAIFDRHTHTYIPFYRTRRIQMEQGEHVICFRYFSIYSYLNNADVLYLVVFLAFISLTEYLLGIWNSLLNLKSKVFSILRQYFQYY